MNVIKNITPSRLRNNNTPNRELPNALEEIINTIIKFIIYEIQTQNIDNAELQTYQDYTKKLISMVQNNKKKEKNKSI